MKTSANKYRFFLILLLVAVLGGGIWYCYRMYDDSRAPEEGTLVESEDGNAGYHLS